MSKITKNFTTNEMKCPCCDACEMDITYASAVADNATFFGANF